MLSSTLSSFRPLFQVLPNFKILFHFFDDCTSELDAGGVGGGSSRTLSLLRGNVNVEELAVNSPKTDHSKSIIKLYP